MNTISPIQRACDVVGGQSQLAACLSVTPAFVHQWVRGIRRVPVGRCPAIEQATEGAVTCEQLRPDMADYWAFLRGSREPAGTDQTDDQQAA